jgi:hypothetical protein
MCRWLAYSGSPISLEAVLLEPEHSLFDQSLHARMGVETTNGDGFGIGWYGDGREPGIYRSIGPAWNDQNLRELYPDNERIASVLDKTRLVVSEPLVDLPGAWNEVPESSCGVVGPSADELRPFRPRR